VLLLLLLFSRCYVRCTQCATWQLVLLLLLLWLLVAVRLICSYRPSCNTDSSCCCCGGVCEICGAVPTAECMAGSTDAAPASEPELLQLLHCLGGPTSRSSCTISGVTGSVQQGAWHFIVSPLLLLLLLWLLLLHVQR
jgi:hypothetical protein